MVTIKKNAKKFNSYKLVFDDITGGKILSIIHALRKHENSPVANDVLESMKQAISPSNLNPFDHNDKSIEDAFTD
jgi:hypothetical protein